MKNNENIQQYALYKLTQLLIKEDFEEKQTGKVIYVKKTQAYKDLINLIKEVWNEEIKK
jgi:hypothetical protein